MSVVKQVSRERNLTDENEEHIHGCEIQQILRIWTLVYLFQGLGKLPLEDVVASTFYLNPDV